MLDKLRQWWQSLRQSQRITLILGCTLILVTIAVLAQLILRPAYTPLFTELEPLDAGKIIEELESANTPYQLADNGKTIEVPEDMVYRLRIQMASTGVLHSSGVGFELFDQKKFGITEFEQHVGYQRALQEELRRTIVQLGEVEQARVHLVLPRESVFLDEQVTPSASIALKIRPNVNLGSDQVRGIQSLVMGSIQGLTPENVHIIDMNGNMLNDTMKTNEEETLSASSMQRYELKKQYERELENRVQQMLNRILGPGRAVAMITADLDFDQQETVRTEHGPGAILSEQSVIEEGTSAATGGVPGMDSEMPGETMPFEDSGTGNGYSREQQATNYEVDTTQQVTVKAPGSIRSLSVSVVVDGTYLPANLDSIQQVVASAVGYSAQRGDQMTVSSMSFNDASIPSFEEPASEVIPPVALPVSPLVTGLALGALLLLILAVGFFRRRANKRREMLLAIQADEEALSRAKEEKAEKKQIVLEEPQSGYRSVIKQISKEKPTEVVEVLKVWLRE
ncbi:MAG TPA: flagellar M-ring protein FliF [Desulfotomaculum sp.]|nr:MAG: hypothetical protein JL56_05035 [Desulfotomaculum sp. BICA1-6]HBX23706.1 flagellar M-ring protein FliF [Desulfotomaculum sp.]